MRSSEHKRIKYELKTKNQNMKYTIRMKAQDNISSDDYV